MHKLKPLIIKNAKPGKYADGGGLYFVKTTESAKWIYRFSVNGKRREMGLGPFPTVSLAEARRERDRWAEELRAGRDPITEREKQRQDASNEMNKTDPLFSELAQMIFEAKQPGLRGDGERGRWFSPIKIHLLPSIGNKRVSQINQRDVIDALKPIWRKKPPTAKKTQQRLRAILHRGKLMGFETDPFIVDAAILTLGEWKHKTEHIKATDWRDIPALYQKLNKPYPTHRALRLAILTAVRADSIRKARKDEFQDDVWTIPEDRIKGFEGKVKDFRVPLSAQIQAELKSWMKETDEEHLFIGPRGNPISDQALHKALNAIGEEGRPHGFRTSFRTWVQDTEAATYEVAETALGHVIGSDVERSYARSDRLDQRRILMQKWADFVTGAEAKVIRLRG